MIVKLISVVLILIGVVLIYDARPLTNKWFGFGDQNEAATRLKNIWLFICNNWSNNLLYNKNIKNY